MKSIAIYNNKGGVAKTTSVINLAYELAHTSRVLIIDTDGQANCSRFFVDEPKKGFEKALTDAAASPVKALCKTRFENIDIITATAALNRATTRFEKFSDEVQTEIARKIISFGSEYDYVLFDMPPALTVMTERLVGACDVVFVPIELGTFAIQGVPTVTGIVNKCGAKFGGCFVTKYDKKNSADAQLLELLKQTLGGKTLNTTIPFSKVIKNSISGGLTASEYMGWTNAGKSYAALAEEIKETVKYYGWNYRYDVSLSYRVCRNNAFGCYIVYCGNALKTAGNPIKDELMKGVHHNGCIGNKRHFIRL